MSQEAALEWALALETTDRWRKLAEAIAGGALRVRFADGREVTYHSSDEMWSTLLAGYGSSLSATTRRPPVSYAKFSRGW